jgi:hypothetical protein
MYIEPVNPIVKKTLDDCLTKGAEVIQLIHDYDQAMYQVKADEENIYFGFKCLCS